LACAAELLRISAMRAFYTDIFVLPLPEGHRFPMAKYRVLRERLLQTGVIAPEELCVPHAATDAELLRAHDAEYVQSRPSRAADGAGNTAHRLPLDACHGRALAA
jgi:acetoin utilization deacetylase AcuC-like enzyme